MSGERKALACELVALEAQLLDEQRWDDWLALYSEDAVFWVPTWRNDSELTSDPSSELSLIYLEGRRYLAERVFRVTSGQSVASVPIPRTVHLVAGSVTQLDDNGETAHVCSAWSTHIHHQRDNASTTYAGRYRHDLEWRQGRFCIRSKKVVLMTDLLSSKLDFFYV